MARNRIPFLVLAGLLLAGCASRTLTVPPPRMLIVDGVIDVRFVVPNGGWIFTREPSETIVRQMIDHLREEFATAGRRASDAQLAEIARQRLAVNEGFLVNPESEAYLMIDFRRFRPGEKVPGSRDLTASAKGAELALRSEAGVTSVSSRIRRFPVPGSLHACRTDIDYLLHETPRKFIGIIGATETHKFYFYFNDPLRDPLDSSRMDRVFDSLVLGGPGD
ncbi:MAG: hypothetical protein R2940_05710 [Syntrophotaleaceae bacterium]